MTKRKRITICTILVLLIAGLVLGGCTPSGTGDNNTESGKPKVIAVNFPAYDFARQVAGDEMEVEMLLSPGAEAHSFEPTPQDIIAIQKADLFIYTGGEGDGWVEDILESADAKNLKTVAMMDLVTVVPEVTVEGMEADEHAHEGEEGHDHEGEEGHDHEAEAHAHGDEHVWTSPLNAIKIVSGIEEAMVEIDPDQRATYEKNAGNYIGELGQLNGRFHELVNTAARKTIVVGDRFPFRYLADEYGLTYFAAFPGCSDQVEPSAATVAFLIDKIKAEKIPVVFTIELSNGKVADTIAESTGAKKLTLNSCHNLTKEEFAAGKTYLDFMNENVEALKEALN